MSHIPRIFLGLQKDGTESLPVERFSVDATIDLSTRDAHHLIHVLRLSDGAEVIAVLPSGSHADCTLERPRGRESVARIRVRSIRSGPSPAPRVGTLLMAILKGDHTELVCEKVSELGVSRLILFVAERSVVRLHGDEDRAKKEARWRRICEAAAKQSRQSAIPTLHVVDSCATGLAVLKPILSKDDKLFCCSLAPGAVPMRELPPPAGSAHIAVGPEGDFSSSEEDSLVDFGFERIRLGRTVLRSETAAIAAVASAYSLWGDREVSSL